MAVTVKRCGENRTAVIVATGADRTTVLSYRDIANGGGGGAGDVEWYAQDAADAAANVFTVSFKVLVALLGQTEAQRLFGRYHGV